MRGMPSLRRFRQSQEGAVTAEFVIGFPIVFIMVLLLLELCFMMVRSTMLQHGLDTVLREVRLGEIVNPQATDLERMICDRIGIVPDCTTSLVLEFTQVDLATFAMPGTQAPCERRSEAMTQARAGQAYATGEQNQLVVVRACIVMDSITPYLTEVFQMTARSAFVVEPVD